MTTPTSFRSRGPTDPDPFHLGWRYEHVTNVDGSTEWTRIPLTAEDLLHPREGDHIPENTMQERDRSYLASVLRLKADELSGVLVLSDCLIDWGVPDLRNHSADIAVFAQLKNREQVWSTFHVRKEGACPLFVIEIVSPNPNDKQVRDNDVVEKVREYYQAGVPFYVVVDQLKTGATRSLLGYKHGAHAFEQVPLDGKGRLLLAPLGVLLQLKENKVVCLDAETGNEIGDFAIQYQDCQTARQEWQVAEQAREAAEQAREAAEQSRAAAEQARRTSEQELYHENVRRVAAEKELLVVSARLSEDLERGSLLGSILSCQDILGLDQSSQEQLKALSMNELRIQAEKLQDEVKRKLRK